MPKIISLHIFRKIAGHFLLSVAVLSVVSILSRVFKLVELAVNYGVGALMVLKLIIHILPSFLIYIIPISLLMAALTAYHRLSAAEIARHVGAATSSITRAIERMEKVGR